MRGRISPEIRERQARRARSKSGEDATARNHAAGAGNQARNREWRIRDRARPTSLGGGRREEPVDPGGGRGGDWKTLWRSLAPAAAAGGTEVGEERESEAEGGRTRGDARLISAALARRSHGRWALWGWWGGAGVVIKIIDDDDADASDYGGRLALAVAPQSPCSLLSPTVIKARYFWIYASLQSRSVLLSQSHSGAREQSRHVTSRHVASASSWDPAGAGRVEADGWGRVSRRPIFFYIFDGGVGTRRGMRIRWLLPRRRTDKLATLTVRPPIPWPLDVR
jgi:hypothetical protein